jgi:hypothetical protein
MRRSAVGRLRNALLCLQFAVIVSGPLFSFVETSSVVPVPSVESAGNLLCSCPVLLGHLRKQTPEAPSSITREETWSLHHAVVKRQASSNFHSHEFFFFLALLLQGQDAS